MKVIDNNKYCHAPLGQQSFIDYVYINRNLINAVLKLRIINDVSNTSDHLPITFDLSLNKINLSNNIRRVKTTMLQNSYETNVI